MGQKSQLGRNEVQSVKIETQGSHATLSHIEGVWIEDGELVIRTLEDLPIHGEI